MKSLQESLLDNDDELFDRTAIHRRELIEEFIKENYKITGKYIINDDNTVDIQGGIYVCSQKINSLTSLTNDLFTFRQVTDNFSCSLCENLKSLKGGPCNVDGMYDCSFCSNLISLEGAPKQCYDFDCGYCNKIVSLKGAPKKLGSGDFVCTGCENLKSLEGAPKRVYGDFVCNECEKLISLKGAPVKVGGGFNCQNCKKLTSLEDAPENVNDFFNCSSCGTKWEIKDVTKYSKVKGNIYV